ncbi:MAG: bifunctional 3-(3-hydroxy-phenyl)propionate/3-hydroxycinnamic acid hydroxylase [Corynebacteriales bacterium]|nr:bifunctional 3-(3-hydroxy-phenyl)propionate/3-hydroxycinnamic acid hydroxylase [Mycobacteriales bacterium]
MTTQRASTTVVIVGAGPVGVTAALLLARRGVATVVLERHPEPYALPRAVHLDDDVFRILQAAGVDEAFRTVSRPMPGMRLIDGRGRVMAEFGRDTDDGPQGFPPDSMFDQPDLERILHDAASREPLIDMRRGCEVVDVVEGPTPTVRHIDADGVETSVAGAAVIACDGANSLVRESLGITSTDLRFAEKWLVIDVNTPRPLDVWDGVHQICDPARAATFMPVTGNRYRWEFRVHDGEDLDALVSVEGLRNLLSPWMSADEIDESEILRRAFYTFRARVADRWRAGGIFLAGDAAHQTPPFVGQGLGSGLRDVANLTWKLADVLDGTARGDLLDTYEVERRPHAIAVIRMALAVGMALTGGQDRFAGVRRLGVAAVCRVPGLAAVMPAVGVPPLRPGPLVMPTPLLRRMLLRRVNGSALPQPVVGFASDTARLDELIGSRWALVTRGRVPETLPARVADVGAVHIDADRLATHPAGVASPARWLRRHHAVAVLVRPDRMVAASATDPDGIGDLLTVLRDMRSPAPRRVGVLA